MQGSDGEHSGALTNQSENMWMDLGKAANTSTIYCIDVLLYSSTILEYEYWTLQSGFGNRMIWLPLIWLRFQNRLSNFNGYGYGSRHS
jgi:hypothetical protein